MDRASKPATRDLDPLARDLHGSYACTNCMIIHPTDEEHMDHPMSGIHFTVEWGGTRLGFSEVSGLDIEVDVIEYREGNSKEFALRKMPGLVRYGNVIFRRGLMPDDNDLFDWFRTIQLNKVERRDIIVSLLNENHEPVVVWRLRNAFPVKLSGPVLNAKGSDVAIETLEVAHEGLVIEGSKR